jgi:hypothetical protein
MLSFRTIPVAEHVLQLAHRLRTVWSVLTNQRVQIGTAFSDSPSQDEQPMLSQAIVGKLPPAIQRIHETEHEIRQKHALAVKPMDNHQYQMEVERLCSKRSLYNNYQMPCKLTLTDTHIRLIHQR